LRTLRVLMAMATFREVRLPVRAPSVVSR